MSGAAGMIDHSSRVVNEEETTPNGVGEPNTSTTYGTSDMLVVEPASALNHVVVPPSQSTTTSLLKNDAVEKKKKQVQQQEQGSVGGGSKYSSKKQHHQYTQSSSSPANAAPDALRCWTLALRPYLRGAFYRAMSVDSWQALSSRADLRHAQCAHEHARLLLDAVEEFFDRAAVALEEEQDRRKQQQQRHRGGGGLSSPSGTYPNHRRVSRSKSTTTPSLRLMSASAGHPSLFGVGDVVVVGLETLACEFANQLSGAIVDAIEALARRADDFSMHKMLAPMPRYTRYKEAVFHVAAAAGAAGGCMIRGISETNSARDALQSAGLLDEDGDSDDETSTVVTHTTTASSSMRRMPSSMPPTLARRLASAAKIPNWLSRIDRGRWLAGVAAIDKQQNEEQERQQQHTSSDTTKTTMLMPAAEKPHGFTGRALAAVAPAILQASDNAQMSREKHEQSKMQTETHRNVIAHLDATAKDDASWTADTELNDKTTTMPAPATSSTSSWTSFLRFGRRKKAGGGHEEDSEETTPATAAAIVGDVCDHEGTSSIPSNASEVAALNAQVAEEFLNTARDGTTTDANVVIPTAAANGLRASSSTNITPRLGAASRGGGGGGGSSSVERAQSLEQTGGSMSSPQPRSRQIPMGRAATCTEELTVRMHSVAHLESLAQTIATRLCAQLMHYQDRLCEEETIDLDSVYVERTYGMDRGAVEKPTPPPPPPPPRSNDEFPFASPRVQFTTTAAGAHHSRADISPRSGGAGVGASSSGAGDVSGVLMKAFDQVNHAAREAETGLARACGFAAMLVKGEKNHLGAVPVPVPASEEASTISHPYHYRGGGGYVVGSDSGGNGDKNKAAASCSGASSAAEALSVIYLGDLDRLLPPDSTSMSSSELPDITLGSILASGNAVHLAAEHLRASLPSRLAPVALQACTRVICTLMRYALVDGGPGRAFTTRHVRVVLGDIDKLRSFHATLGLAPMDLEWSLQAAGIWKVLDLMALDSWELLEHMCDVLEHGRLLDATLMRVVCHRRDRQVSKVLKRRFNLPKV